MSKHLYRRARIRFRGRWLGCGLISKYLKTFPTDRPLEIPLQEVSHAPYFSTHVLWEELDNPGDRDDGSFFPSSRWSSSGSDSEIQGPVFATNSWPYYNPTNAMQVHYISMSAGPNEKQSEEGSSSRPVQTSTYSAIELRQR
jgi:hypothetical protein